MNILLTGFDTFGTVVDNPSARLVKHFAMAGLSGHTLTTHVFPVSFARAENEVAALLREGHFELALLMGVAGNAAEFRLEQFGRNRDVARIPDCDGSMPQETTIYPDAPALYPSTAAIEPLHAALSAAGLPVRRSEDAGGYVCNHLFYVALHVLAQLQRPTRCLFLHVPPDDRTFADSTPHSTVPLNKQIEVVERIIAYLE